MTSQPVNLATSVRPLFSLALALLIFLAAPLKLAAHQEAPTQSANTAAPTTTLQSGGPPQSDRPVLQHRDDRYRLCASDVVALTFPLTPEFDQTVNIQPDGFASLAGVGDVRLEGLTTAQSAEAIRTAYTKVLHDPIVTIELKTFNKPYFVVNGQVHQPGRYDLRGYTTATQAIAIAGGFEDSAKHSQVLLFRRVNNDWYEVKNLNLKRIMQGHDVSEDPEIRPGDMLVVIFNFAPARIFMGDSGSTTLGFTVAFLALAFCRSSGGTTHSLAFPLLVAALPLFDAGLAVVRRLRDAASPFYGDRRHLYDLLLARGWSSRKVALVSYSVTAAMGAIGWIGLRLDPERLWLLAALSFAALFVAALRLGSLRAERRVQRMQAQNARIQR